MTRLRLVLAVLMGVAVVPALYAGGTYADRFVMNFPLLPAFGALTLLGLILGSGILWAFGTDGARESFLTLSAFALGLVLSGLVAVMIWNGGL